MAENNQHFNIQELADKWAQGKLTPEERAYLERWYAGFNDESISITDSEHENSEALRKAMLDRINTQIQKEEKPTQRIVILRRLAAAASILLFLSIGAYFLVHKKAPQPIAQNGQHDIAPGHNQATLTLAGGEKIILTKGLTGTLAQQGNMTVRINNNNAVAYSLSSAATGNSAIAYNTLSTAKGEMSPYPLILADGTRVWLDAESSITFPVAFAAKERLVKVTGQAYFEVAHNAAQPFKVSVRNMTVEDVGTAFNINAYEDEPVIKTTLVHGAVKVSLAHSDQIVSLLPGQAAITTKGNGLKVKEDDLDETISWRKGDFTFNDENIQNIMRQLSRWYNIDVAYEGKPNAVLYNSKLSRYKNISQMLKILSLTQNVHFKVEGRRVIVTP